MKKLITYVAAGLLVIGAQSLMAQSTTNSTSTPSAQTPAKHGMTHEQRQELLKLLGLTPADLKPLTPKERQAKIRDTAKEEVSDLKAKKQSGALSSEDQAKLTKLEAYLAHSGHKKAAATSEN